MPAPLRSRGRRHLSGPLGNACRPEPSDEAVCHCLGEVNVAEEAAALRVQCFALSRIVQTPTAKTDFLQYYIKKY